MGGFYEYSISTSSRCCFVDVTSRVRQAVKDSGVKEGLCAVFVPHTTAGITINENADPDVTADMTSFLKRSVPQDPGFAHSEGNSDAHIKTTLVGPSITLIIRGGAPVLGTWQAVYFAEFDGPRQRRMAVKCLEG